MIPKVKDTAAAKHKIWIVLSSKFSRIISHNVFGGLTIGALVPNLSERQLRSLPSAEIPFYL